MRAHSSISTLAVFHDETMQRPGFPLIGLIVFGGVVLGLGALASASNLPEQNIIAPASLQPSAATHETRTDSQNALQFSNRGEISGGIETVASAPSTRSSIMAIWESVSGANGYFLDVSTSNSFSSYVAGYHGLGVGNVNGRAVTGLNPGTIYYYRVRPYTAAGSGGYSNVMTAATVATTGLIIQATFDSSITGNPEAVAIEAMINRAIRIYESLFSDPITIDILFRYSDSAPAPSPTPLPPGVLATSLSTIYTVSWNDFISALRADATTSKDNMAKASLPGNPLSANVAPSSANGRAVGLNTPHAMFRDGHIGQGGPYDGIVTLNSAQPFWFSRPLISGSFDAQHATEHEIDEVIGLGSYLNRNAPRPCPSYEAESVPPNTIAGGAVIQSCPTCSGGEDVGFVGNNSGTLRFNGITANASGRLNVRISYTNGDAVRYALLSVNGGPGTPLSFPSTGSFQTVGSIETTITNLNPGSNNTLMFYNPIIGNWAPDFDRIEVTCTIPPPATLRPQDLFSWSSAGVRNLTLDGSRYFSIDSGSTKIVGFNQTAPGDFGDWLSEACPQRHPFVQNAVACPDQFSDISATSPEGINLDVIGYDLTNRPPDPVTNDFNNDGHPDYLLYNSITQQTMIWYLNNNIFTGSASGPNLPGGWQLITAADFNRDGHPDCLLFSPVTRQTVIWYMNNNVHIGGATGPTIPPGWSVETLGDFNSDGYPDYVLYNPSTHQTVVWYMRNNVHIGGGFWPTIPPGWRLAGVADFNGDGHPDYLLINTSTRATVIWYLSGATHTSSRTGPTIVPGWDVVGVADFDGNGRPDYLLYNSNTRQTAIWYLNNNVFIHNAGGPTLPAGWMLVAP